MLTLKISSMLLILTISLLAGYYPFYRKIKSNHALNFPIGEALATGVFLGAGLLHMLAEATEKFDDMGYQYPISFLISGITFLLFLLLEHIGRELYHKKDINSNAFAILAVIMLSIHSFFTGAALGLGDTTSVVVMMLFAVLAHKWAEGFALAVQISRSSLSLPVAASLYLTFSLMVPAGIVSGSLVTSYQEPALAPFIGSISAGTFLYLGTLHGLEQATLIKQCCNLNHYYFVILGFVLMAVVAIWT